MPNKEGKSEVKKLGVYLTWQNAGALILILVTIMASYFDVKSGMREITTTVKDHGRRLGKVEDWTKAIGVKTGTPPPSPQVPSDE